MDVSEELTLATTTTTTPMTPPTKDVAEELTLATTTTTSTPKDLAEELTLATTTTTSTPKDLAEELTLATTTTTPTTKDLASIVKGKRTKRQRPQSPIPFTITSHLSGGEITLYGGDHNNSSPSRPASSDEQAISTTTEDEDTARLLLMLARGQSRERSISNKKEIDHYYQDQDYTTSSFKFNSKRYIETSSTINGKAGMYVYECKTCNRTFPSFQALGGHRASHKKPKNLAIAALAEEKKQQSSYAFSDEDETSFKINNIAPISYSNMINKSSTAKIHECSYCGAEFTSGQALGGHMRRHRGANNAAPVAAPPATNTALSLSPLSPTSVNQDSEEAAKKRRKIMNHNSGLSLSLDLNLPAPEDDHNKYSSFANKNQQQQTQQQQKEPTLLLSNTPTLVDCHY